MAYSDALAAGDYAVCDAVESASSIWPGKPGAELMRELQAQRLAQKDPELNDEQHFLSVVERDLGSALTVVEVEIEEAAGPSRAHMGQGPRSVIESGQGSSNTL